MEIVVTHEDGNHQITVFNIKGTFRSSEKIKDLAQFAFDQGARHMIVDFSEVDFMSSAGLQGLHFIYMLLRGTVSEAEEKEIKKGITDGTYTSPHLKLVNPNHKVKEVLSLTGYDMFIEIHDDLQTAVNSF